MVDFARLLKEKAERDYENFFGTARPEPAEMAKLEKAPQYIKGEDIQGKKGLRFKFLSEFVRGGDYQKLSGDIQVIDGEDKYKAKWSMSDKVGNQVIDALGDDSAEWVGKEVEVQYAEVNGHKTIILAQETL